MDRNNLFAKMAGVARFELTNAGIKIRCLTAWLYPNEILWGGRRESNPRPPGPQSGALTNWATPAIKFGAPEESRTPDTWLRRPLLYPTELQAHTWRSYLSCVFGAGDGNRTHATSLEGWNSTIELHPHFLSFGAISTTPVYNSTIKKNCQIFFRAFLQIFGKNF